MASIFTKIVNGDIPAYKVAETEDFLAFLDIRPRVKGHTLCIPKVEVDYVFDLDDERYIGLQIFAREVARALEKTVPCKRIATAVLGLEVPHAHIHLLPINSMQEFGFHIPPIEITSEEMETLAANIRANVALG
ncbi:MAG: HIT family protein [Bacteroidota bacterium]